MYLKLKHYELPGKSIPVEGRVECPQVPQGLALGSTHSRVSRSLEGRASDLRFSPPRGVLALGGGVAKASTGVS